MDSPRSELDGHEPAPKDRAGHKIRRYAGSLLPVGQLIALLTQAGRSANRDIA